MADDLYNLKRFVTAQGQVYSNVLDELRSGQKQSHWMWYVFPQLRGLGQSEMASEYGIASAEEARVYLSDPVLGTRLIECTRLVLDVEGRSIQQIFGYPDYLKFRSCMTLFAEVAGPGSAFHEALGKYFTGTPDPLTVGILSRSPEIRS